MVENQTESRAYLMVAVVWDQNMVKEMLMYLYF